MDDLVNQLPPHALTNVTHTGQPGWAGADGATWRAIARHLLEFDLLRQYRLEGYESTAHYAECRLGFTPRQTAEVLRVSKKLLDLPLVDSALFYGVVTWEQVVMLTRVVEPEHQVAWLQRMLNLPAGEQAAEAPLGSSAETSNATSERRSTRSIGEASSVGPWRQGGSAASDARVACARDSWRMHGTPNVRQSFHAPPSTS